LETARAEELSIKKKMPENMSKALEKGFEDLGIRKKQNSPVTEKRKGTARA